jgi:hypothetical protein
MVRSTGVLPMCAAGVLVLLPAALQAQGTDGQLPVSLARIRAALAAPPPVLQMPAPVRDVPTFRVEVNQPFSMSREIEEAPFDPTWGLPSAGELMMGGIEKLRSAVVDYKRARDRRRAREEVQDALAAFCAVHECPSTAQLAPK